MTSARRSASRCWRRQRSLRMVTCFVSLGRFEPDRARWNEDLPGLKNSSHEDCADLYKQPEALPIPDGIAGKQAIRTMQLGSAGYIAEARASAEEYARQSTTAGSDDIDYDRIGDMFLTLARIHALLGNVHEAVAAFEQSRHAYRDAVSPTSRNQVMSSASSELTFVVTAYQADEGSRKQRITDEIQAAHDRARVGFPRHGRIRMKLLPWCCLKELV